jgi:hypothetical protein
VNRRQQQGNQNADDGNDHQWFDQRERASSTRRHFSASQEMLPFLALI